jgi:hypothetical protein
MENKLLKSYLKSKDKGLVSKLFKYKDRRRIFLGLYRDILKLTPVVLNQDPLEGGKIICI